MNLLRETNRFLAAVHDMGTLGWQSGIIATYPDAQVDTAIRALQSVFDYVDSHPTIGQANGRRIPRYIKGSMVEIGEETMPDLLPSERMKVLETVKSHRRGMQIGGGKGKGLLMFGTGIFFPNALNDSVQGDPLDLLKRLKDEITLYADDIEYLKNKLESKNHEIDALHEQIQRIESQPLRTPTWF